MTCYEIHCPKCGVLIRELTKPTQCPDCGEPQAIALYFTESSGRCLERKDLDE